MYPSYSTITVYTCSRCGCEKKEKFSHYPSDCIKHLKGELDELKIEVRRGK